MATVAGAMDRAESLTDRLRSALWAANCLDSGHSFAVTADAAGDRIVSDHADAAVGGGPRRLLIRPSTPATTLRGSAASAPGERALFADRAQFVLERRGGNAERLMSRCEALGQDREDGIALTGSGELLAEAGAMHGRGHGREANTGGLEHTAHVTLNILPQQDQPLPRPDQRAQPVGRFAPDMDFRVPARAGELGQALSVSAARLVQPRRERLVRLPRIDADDRQALLFQLPVKPGR